MPVEVIMPKVDMDMTHGTLAVWHVAEGATVAQGAALFDIETDKAAMEVEAPVAGRLHHISAAPGDKVAVGTAVAWLYAEGEAVGPAPTTGAGPAPRAAADEPLAQPTITPPTTGTADGEAPVSARATPAARAAARAAGIAVADVPGSGPLGRVQRDDVAAFLGPPPSAAGAAVWVPQPGPLSVTRRPGAGAPILLIHGFTADSQSWAPLEKALGTSRGLIRLDLPGHGKSPRRRITGFADLTRMTVEAFDDATRDLDQVHIVAHSLGGAAALAIADLRARRTASITLIAPAGLGPEIDAAALNGIVRAGRADSLAPWLRRLTATPDGISDDYARAAMRLRQDPPCVPARQKWPICCFPTACRPSTSARHLRGSTGLRRYSGVGRTTSFLSGRCLPPMGISLFIC